MASTGIDVPRLSELYRTMCRIRAFEEAAERAHGEGLVPGALHVSIGQEAVAAGVCSALGPDDVITSTHRGHGHALAKGLDPLAMMRELLGRAGGTCGGKGGSMHLADLELGMLGANGIVGDGLTIAAGAAHALKLSGKPGVAVGFFGDGGVNRGPFLEALNWAAVFELPLVFVCEDNAYASTTRSAAVTAGAGADARAAGIGVESRRVDGNDVLALASAAAELVADVRAGGGPRFLHAATYRLRGHTANDEAAYRGVEEVAEAAERDPLRAAEALLADAAGDGGWRTLQAEARAEMDQVLTTAAASDFPPPSEAFTGVQDVGAIAFGPDVRIS